jgi:hypothetical protein
MSEATKSKRIDVEEARMAKRKLEEAIQALVQKFEEETGIAATGIRFGRVREMGYRTTRLCDVTIQTELE